MKNINVILGMLALVIIVGCSANFSSNNEPENKTNNAKQLVKDLVYVRDDKSGLCFAYSWYSANSNHYGSPVFTEVACEKVEKLLIK